MNKLLMIVPSPVHQDENYLTLDKKFVEGMKLHRELWGGQIDCILRSENENIPFGVTLKQSDLDFGVRILDAEESITGSMIRGYDLVLCSGDDHNNLHLSNLGRRENIKVIYTIEYILETRVQIALLDNSRSLLKRLYSVLWNCQQEIRRRHAFSHAYGLQSNGYPGWSSYSHLNSNSMLYLDNRMKPELLSQEREEFQRFERIKGRTALYLIYSGRLEAMKGAQDLVPLACRLREKKIEFKLDIFGDGSMRGEILQKIKENNLSKCVIFHGPVDFEKELVPYSRNFSDIFICCHRQSDPSCTYLESMGCGLPILGYDNKMWSALQEQSKSGWVVPLGDIEAMAERLSKLNRNRDKISKCAKNALRFARRHDFYSEFEKRMSHLVTAVNNSKLDT